MSHASPSHDVSNETLLQVIQQLSTRLDRFEQAHDRYTNTALPQIDTIPVVNTRIIGVRQATTLRPNEDLVRLYPAILEQNFYTAELADDHQFFSLSDYHYTEGMVYKAPPVLDHAEVTLSPAAKKHDADLAIIQTRMAHHTRFYDTFASDILERKWETSESGKAMLQFLNTLRIAAANDAAKISQLRMIRLRLQDTHQQLTIHPYHLMLALSRMLDVKADHKVKDLSRLEEHEPLSGVLSSLTGSSDPYLMYQACYAFQALQYVPDDGTVLQAVLRQSIGVAGGLVKISVVMELDVSVVLEGPDKLQEVLGNTVEITGTVYEGFCSLMESGRGVLTV
ncbi:hypothetical protein EC957_008675 [Mortierella hygrophila]|uniref:Arm-like repeat domain-containing protein n=1 Tax=Mortierella hygrophila TaxID=979708 RepID=A0A9P6EW06_9FUNG|nr:hypothetical protein EC957_008675 [Mortierella hygrophila]